MEDQITDIIQRLAMNSIVVAIDGYERTDKRFTRAERATATEATWNIFAIVADTLSGRRVEIIDPPTKVEALVLLKQLLFEVPNNLTKASRLVALDAITVLTALLPDENPGGLVN